MLDFVGVVTAGGIFVWTFDFGSTNLTCAESHSKETEKYIFLIRNLFCNELSRESGLRNAAGSLLVEPFCVEWSMAEKLIFVAIHRRVLNLVWVKEFLVDFQTGFLSKYVELSLNVLRFLKSGQQVKFEDESFDLLALHENSASKSTQSKFVSNGASSKKKLGVSQAQTAKSRVWELENKNTSSLDYSAETSSESSEKIRVRLQKMMCETKGVGNAEGKKPKDSDSSSKITGFLKTFVDGKVLTAQMLSELKPKLKELLMSKNVASDVAETVCNGVVSSLTGKKVSAFKSSFALLKEAASKAIEEILQPDSTLDLKQEVQKHLSADRPYTIAFIGVNGVGKSTNLSKVCFYLLQMKCKILIAACDTFRSGAVEQLRTHVRNLKILDTAAVVDIFERGYGKDPAGIAKEAIKHARNNGYDVVLIDTAGRMQENEPLMRSLANLVYTNPINKIVFVGEALVGNEAVDQLSKFNQAIKDFSNGDASAKNARRRIDAILLTKFDTVDDKVGAALSMSYIAKAPIMFVGTGQTYTDLKKINVEKIVEVLLK